VPQRFLELLRDVLYRILQLISEALECGRCRISQLLAEAGDLPSQVTFEHLKRSLELTAGLAGGGVEGCDGVRALFCQGLRRPFSSVLGLRPELGSDAAAFEPNLFEPPRQLLVQSVVERGQRRGDLSIRCLRRAFEIRGG